MSVSRIVLVGFMGAGKSVVGRRLAREIAWSFVDADRMVEAKAGRTVREIFEDDGEEHFRRLEAQTMDELLQARRVVVASGGGWAAREGRLDGLPPEAVTVWLDVSPEEAVRRAAHQGAPRPLLEVRDPEARARALLEARREHYSRATFRVDTDGRTVEDVTARIRRMLAEPGTEIDAP